jgi:hypothetical protein
MAKSGDFEAAASPAASANCYYGNTCYFECQLMLLSLPLKPAASSNLLIDKLEEVADF